MINYDIDVDYFSKRGLLTIFEVPDLMKHPKGVLKGSEDLVDELFYNINQKRPFWLVIRMIACLNSKDQIEANLMLEQYYHSKFDSFNGNVLCYYNVNPHTININNKWPEIILQNHHSAIFITDNPEEGGIAFDMQ
jgi:hypothetical protein